MGKHKYIETPEKMWELFEAYRKEVKSNPRHTHEFVGKDGNQVLKPLERPLTLEGFENYVSELGVIENIDNYFANSNDAYTDYSSICSRIRKVIRQDQIEGGMVGQYNPSITQRLNGLTDKQESKVTLEQGIFNVIDLDVPTDNGTS